MSARNSRLREKPPSTVIFNVSVDTVRCPVIDFPPQSSSTQFHKFISLPQLSLRVTTLTSAGFWVVGCADRQDNLAVRSTESRLRDSPLIPVRSCALRSINQLENVLGDVSSMP